MIVEKKAALAQKPKHKRRYRMVKGLFSLTMGAFFTQSVIPSAEIIEKSGVWGLVALLVWWILGVLSKKLDALSASIDKLADRVHDQNRSGD